VTSKAPQPGNAAHAARHSSTVYSPAPLPILAPDSPAERGVQTLPAGAGASGGGGNEGGAGGAGGGSGIGA